MDVTPGQATTTDSFGRYQISVDKGWSGAIVPSASGSQFSPPSRVYYSVASDRPSQDFSIGAMVYLPLIIKPQ